MDFTLTPEPVHFASDALLATSEQPVDLDFTLPDYCADVEKIFKCTVVPEIYSTNSGGGQLTVEGASQIRVLYCSSDKKHLKCAEQTLPFSAAFNLSPDLTDFTVSVKAKTEYVNCKAVSPRRLMIHGAVSLSVNAREKKPVNLFLPKDETTLQTDLKTLTVSELMSIQSEVFSVSESVAADGKSPIASVLRSEVRAMLTDVSAVGNRLLLKGEVTLCILYSSDLNGDAPKQLTYVFPFVHNMECACVEESLVREIDLSLLSYDIKLKSDIGIDNPSIIIEARLCAGVACRKESRVSYISDAYSSFCQTELEFTPITLEAAVLPKISTVMCKSALSLGEQKISRVIDIFCDNVSVKPYISDILKLSGKANFCILALDENSELAYIERSIEILSEEPLSDIFTKCTDLTAMIKSVSFRLGENNTLELRAEAYILTKLVKTESIHAVSKVTDCGQWDKGDTCSLTLYYAQQGEAVWDIAKRYRTDKKALCAENSINGSDLKDRMLLLIPKV